MPKTNQFQLTTANKTIYANIALNINNVELGQNLYTYSVPEHLNLEIFVGTQVLVGFGNQSLVSGYVVDLNNSSKQDLAIEKIKPIIDVLDSNPLFDRDYVDFLHWLAEYYVASISDVINAAVPKDLGAKIKRVVRLSEGNNSSNIKEIVEQNILKELGATKTKSLSINALKQRLQLKGKTFFTHLNHLKQLGQIVVESQLGKATKTKLISYAQALEINGQELTKRQEIILGCLASGPMLLSQLIEEASTTKATIQKMVSLGLIAITEKEEIRDPLGAAAHQASGQSAFTLTDDQKKVLSILTNALEEKLAKTNNVQADSDMEPWLLHGVTGSGKTEVYLQLIEKALAKNRTALLLVPEISLTPQLAQRLIGRFGSTVAVWHSHLSAGERHDTMRRIKDGSIKVLLGARSAILTNMANIGLIILDEEHDGSYKQTSPSPRYHAKQVAIERAKRCRALVVLGSATPDVSTYYKAKQENKILELPNRVFNQALPQSTIVDMAEEFKDQHRSIFSRLLIRQLETCLANKQQAILLINRRGYANYVLCQACGHTAKCRNCSVSLVFHQSQKESYSKGVPTGRLTCHHCGYTKSAASTCENCDSPFLEFTGVGTQKVELELKKLFPESRLLRLDSDTVRTHHSYEEAFRRFQSGEADILVGTQMVAKGIDIPNVTLVGVLSADAAFNLPDYRSLERGFQLLTQVSGRSGRSKIPGLVVLQAYNTGLPALKLAQNHDYKTFFEEEIQSRQLFDYPPYCQMVRIIVSSDDLMKAEKTANEIAEHLSTYLEDKVNPESIKILGPAPCLIERVKGKYRQHIIIKNQSADLGHNLISSFFKQNRPNHKDTRVLIDIDALDLV